jgi:diphthamide synthase (EF-2-diphthine--ammonia ligase)
MSKCLVSWSSGKDSAWLVHVLRQQPDVQMAALLTTINESAQRVSPCPTEVYERAMAAAVSRAVAEGFTHVAFGDLFLEDVRRYREERLAGTGLTPMFPLFDPSPGYTARLARDMVTSGLRARITCVNPKVIDPKFAGREFDASLLAELPPEIDPCGERGEFHTCSYAGPMFKHAVPIDTGITVERDGYIFTDLCLTPSASSV